MRYQNFIMKIVATMLVCTVLFYYQSIASARAALVAENEAKIAEVEKYNQEIMLENAKREAGSLYYNDGIYEGEGSGYGGIIKVSVTIEYDMLTDVHVISHDGEDPAYYDLASGLADKIVSAQSTDIDTASGATFSSNGILEAVDDALEKAVREP